MAEPLLTSVFGAGATQTISTLTIQKSGLTGLTPAAINTSESLLVAILVRAMLTLTPSAAANNNDQNLSIARTPDTLITVGVSTDYTVNLLVSMRKKILSAGIVPDGY
jgi:hypothetical protein